MILYLGKSDAYTIKLPLGKDLNVALWLREDEEEPATLVTEDGPLAHVTLQEGWRIFVVTGVGSWRARFLDVRRRARVANIVITQDEAGASYVEIL